MQEYLKFALETSQKAGDILLTHYGHTKLVAVVKEREKGLITEADLLSDQLIRQAIATTFPDHSVISEEGPDVKRGSYQWIVDPLDGTNNYRRGDPHFTVSLGLRLNDETILGVVFAPALQEMYYAAKGTGAFLNLRGDQRPISVSNNDCLEMFTLSFATGIDFSEPEKYDKVVENIRNCPLIKQFRRRMLESSAYELWSL